MTEQELERCLPFLLALAESRGDPVVRGQFADYLDECGFPDEAKGQRWAIRNEKHPTETGWWADAYGKSKHHTLPEEFWNERFKGGHAGDALHDVKMYNHLHYERVYLLRCGEMLWDGGGGPVARHKPAAEVVTCPQS